jgi:hypothetical protein
MNLITFTKVQEDRDKAVPQLTGKAALPLPPHYSSFTREVLSSQVTLAEKAPSPHAH